MILPTIVAIVALAFTAILLHQYLDRRRPYQLIWALSLALGCVAGLAFVLFLLTGRALIFFKIYYIAGGLLMAAFLGLGSMYLLAPRRWAHLATALVVVLGIAGIVAVLLAPVDPASLQGADVEAGTRAITGPSIALIALLNTFGAIAVIGGACYSAWGVWKRHGPVQFLYANILIAAGTLLASLAGTLARVTGNGSSFWALLAFGFVVLFAGFLLTTLAQPYVARRGDTASSAAHPA